MRSTVDKILEKVLIGLLSLMLLSVIWQVISRFILKIPSTLTDEISSFSLIWLGLLGAAYGTSKKLHLAIDLIPEKAVEKNRMFFDGFLHGSVFLFAFAVMVVGGTRLCQLTFQFEQTSAAMKIPLGFIYLVVPIAGLLICYYSVMAFMDVYNKNLTK